MVQIKNCLLIVACLFIQNAFACSCFDFTAMCNITNESSLVLLVSNATLVDSLSPYENLVEFDIIEKFNGAINTEENPYYQNTQEKITLFNGQDAMCYIPLFPQSSDTFLIVPSYMSNEVIGTGLNIPSYTFIGCNEPFLQVQNGEVTGLILNDANFVYGPNPIPITRNAYELGSILANSCVTNDAFNSTAMSVKIFPNPSKEVLNFSVSDYGGTFDVVVYNTIGDLVYLKKEMHSILSINLNQFSNGTYFVEIKGAAFNYQSKFIVSK